QQVITTSANAATSVFATDLDGDGDADVLSASMDDDKIAWYENLGGKGNFGAQQIITTSADSARSVYAIDLDGDDDADVLSASRNDGKIAWYENLGGGSFGPQQVITTSANQARCVYATDLDGDGDTDVLSASYNDNKIAWYENLGGGAFGPQQVITTSAIAAISVYATDLDGDSDADVLSASRLDGTLAWYENLGGGAFGAQQLITNGAKEPISVYATDLNGDGHPDVLAACRDDSRIAWYESGVSPNDECVDAFQVGSGAAVAFGTSFATHSASAPARTCGGVVDPIDIWYSFRPVFDGPASVSTCGAASYDTTLEVYSGDCGALVSETCNDDFAGCGGSTSEVHFTATAFTSYYVRVAGFDDATGTGTLVAVYPTAYVNDDCAGALPIGIGETPYNNERAADSGVENCVLLCEANDLWFSYTALGDGPVTIDLSGSSYDTAAAVWTGNCSALIQVDCDDNGGSGATSLLSFSAAAGTTYYLQVGGYYYQEGDGVICVNEGIGSIVCLGNPNSTGVGAVLIARGSVAVADDDTTLEVSGLPQDRTVLFVNSRDTVLVANPGGSQGDLCIGSLAMGRHLDDIANSGATGSASLTLDQADVPTNLGSTAVVAGETWFWQAWYRDVDTSGAPSSNFSSALGVTFQ
ncbi:MAG: VCBS repeat-containing protein, partial [Planctomycetota bacterium]|nr:VCBS repeat-containing protein [Planctomycetota bacterium]